MTHHDPDQLGWRMEGSAAEIADVLAEFARELRSGAVNVWKGQRELHLSPEGKLSLRVEAKADDQNEWLDMRLSWAAHMGGDPLRD
jgi:amphi-Trp domain-containing protein